MAAAINAGDGLGGRAGLPGLGQAHAGGKNFPGMEGLQVGKVEIKLGRERGRFIFTF